MKAILLLILMCYISIQIYASTNETQMDTIQKNIYAADAFLLVDSNLTNPNFVILDIRTASEFNTDHIANAINLDYYSTTFSSELDKLDKSKTYLMHCAGGSRSAPAFTLMKTKKFAQVYQMLGGFNAWKGEGYPTDNTTNIVTIETQNSFKIYPNPAKDKLIVNSEQLIVNENSTIVRLSCVAYRGLVIINTLGQVVYSNQLKINNEELIINIQNLESGIYYVIIGNAMKKLIINS